MTTARPDCKEDDDEDDDDGILNSVYVFIWHLPQ